MERKKISFEKKNHTQKTEKPSSSEGRPLFLVEYSASRAKEAKEAKKPIVLRGGGCSTMDGPIGPRAFRINAAAAARTIAEKLLSCTLMRDLAVSRSGSQNPQGSSSTRFRGAVLRKEWPGARSKRLGRCSSRRRRLLLVVSSIGSISIW